MNLSILRRKDVEKMCGLSRSSIYALIEQGKFPKQIKLSERAVGWISEEIQDFLKSRIETTRNGGQSERS